METLVKHCARCGDEMPLRVPRQGLGRRMADVLAITCPSCSATIEAEEKAARESKRRATLLDLSEIPRELKGLTWADYEPTQGRQAAIRAARLWTQGKIKGLGLIGEVGTGKTRLAGIAARARIDALHSVRWVSVPRLIVMAQQSAFGSEEKVDAQRMLTGRTPLVLDDIDKVNASESVRSLLFLAIDNRVQDGAPMIVTTNLGPDEIERKLGEAIASRLNGHCTWAKVEGPDRRLD